MRRLHAILERKTDQGRVVKYKRAAPIVIDDSETGSCVVAGSLYVHCFLVTGGGQLLQECSAYGVVEPDLASTDSASAAAVVTKRDVATPTQQVAADRVDAHKWNTLHHCYEGQQQSDSAHRHLQHQGPRPEDVAAEVGMKLHRLNAGYHNAQTDARAVGHEDRQDNLQQAQKDVSVDRAGGFGGCKRLTRAGHFGECCEGRAPAALGYRNIPGLG